MNRKADASQDDIEAVRQRLLNRMRDAIRPEDVKAVARTLFNEAKGGGVAAARQWKRALPVFAARLGVTTDELLRQLDTPPDAPPAEEPAPKKTRRKK